MNAFDQFDAQPQADNANIAVANPFDQFDSVPSKTSGQIPDSGALHALSHQATQGLTGNFADRLTAYPLAAIDTLISGNKYADSLKNIRDFQDTENQSEEKNHPIASTAGQILGGIAASGAIASTPAGAAITDSLRGSNLAARTGAGALTGAASGAIYGAGATPYEGSMEQGAEQGALYGIVLGAAAPLAGSAIGALRGVANRNVPVPISTGATASVPAKSLDNARSILKTALQEEGISPDQIADNLEEANKTGLPITALDVATKNVGGVDVQGKNLLGLADAAANMPGTGASLAGNVASRGYTAKERIGNALDKAISNSKYYDVQNDAIQGMEGSGPLYEQAYAANKDVSSPVINRLLKTNAGQKALGYAADRMNTKMSLMGVPDPELAEQAQLVGDYQGGGISKGLKLQTLQYVKEGYDNQIGAALASGERGKASDLIEQKNGLIKELDNIDQQNTGGLYAKARQTYATNAKIQDALEKGRSFMGMDPEEISAFMKDKDVSNPEKVAFSTGVRRSLQDTMSSVGDNANAATRLWKQNIRDRLEPLFPDKQSFDDFSSVMQHEQNMARVNGILTRGSQTMPRQQYADMIGQQPTNASKILGAALNPKGAALNYGVGAMSKALQKSARSMSQDTAEGIMRYLTSNDPQLWREFAAQHFKSGGSVNKTPTEAQKKAGNYAKEHINLHGLNIAIENPKGSIRRGVDKNGKSWQVKMPAAYGYIKRTEGADGDHVDCYVGPRPNSKKVWIVDQKDADNGKFDEHKCFIGFPTKSLVLATYRKAFSDGKADKRIQSITEVSIDELKHWLQTAMKSAA